MDDVVDEVKAHRDGAGKRRAGPELGERERRVGRGVVGEGLDHVVCRRAVGARWVGNDRGEHRLGPPDVELVPVTPCGSREPSVLHGHVGKEVDEFPAGAGRRSVQVFEPNGVDEFDGRQHGDAVEGAEVLRISRHMHIISVRIRYGNA